MDRTELISIRDKHLKRGGRPTGAERQALRAAIAAKLTASDIEEAPRIFGDSGARPMTLNDAVEALMEEL